MPQPTTSLATLRPDLGASLEEFDLAMDRMGFIGQRVLPVIETAVQSGNFGRIPLEQLLQSPEVRRNDRGGYSRGRWEFTEDSFATRERGWEEPVDDREARIYAEYFDAELVSTQRAYDFVLRAQEKRVADLIFDPVTWTGSNLTTAVTNEWDDAVNATPITDVENAVKKIWEQTGLWPNALILNRRVFRNLRNCDQILDRIKYVMNTLPDQITPAILAQAFDLPFILVAGSAINSAKEGQAAALGPIWSDEYAMVARICTTSDIREPGLGRIFHWAGDGSQLGGTVETYRDETIRGDVVRVRHEVHEKLLYTECGHLLSNVTTI